MNSWIDITEYASKYGVSQSTLRRRIRGKSISFKMEKGRYLLEDSVETFRRAPLYARLRQRSAALDPSIPHDYESALRENRKLKEYISELETLVKALEAEMTDV